MSLIARFDGNMNVIGRLLKEYRIKKDLSYEKLSAKLELMGISIHKQSLYDIENNKNSGIYIGEGNKNIDIINNNIVKNNWKGVVVNSANNVNIISNVIMANRDNSV